MVRLKYFAAAFTFAIMVLFVMRIPLYAAQQSQAEFIQADTEQHTDTYEVYSAAQLAAALNGTCADPSYRTMYDQGRIHITMKNVSSSGGREPYVLSFSIIVAEGKQFVLDMNGLDLYASGQEGQGAAGNPVILVPPSSSLIVRSSWVDSSIRNVSIHNQGYLNLNRINVIPAVGQAVYNMGTSDLVSCNLYAGENTAYAVINEGGTLTLDGEDGAKLSELNGIYNVGNGRGNACLIIKNGFYINDMQGQAVVNSGGLVRVGELAEKNSSVIDGSQMGILTVNGGRTEMYDGTVRGGTAAVSTSPSAFFSAASGKTDGSFSMIGGTLSGGYGVAFQADSYVYLKAGTVKGEQAAVASFAYDGTLTDNIASFQFYNTNCEEADAYYYDSAAKTNILCTEISDGRAVLSDGEPEEEPVPASLDNETEDVWPEEPLQDLVELAEVTVGGQDIYWNKGYYDFAAEEETGGRKPELPFPAPVVVLGSVAAWPETSDFYGQNEESNQEGQACGPNEVCLGVGIRDGTSIPGGAGIRDGTSVPGGARVRDGTRILSGTGTRDGTLVSENTGIRDGTG